MAIPGSDGALVSDYVISEIMLSAISQYRTIFGLIHTVSDVNHVMSCEPLWCVGTTNCIGKSAACPVSGRPPIGAPQ